MARTLIGTRLRERRRAQGKTQVALAQAIGISASYLNLIEHNKRGIAGRTLSALARELDTTVADLSDEGDEDTINQLLASAQAAVDVQVEVTRIEEFVGRYPGWARLVQRLSETSKSQGERLRALSERSAQDPFLSETMHEILSNITAIRSTAELLADAGVPAEMQKRFLSNLSADSERLADGARAMVEYFDAEEAEEVQKSDDGTFWPDASVPPVAPKAQSNPLMHEAALKLSELSATMPIEEFVVIARQVGFDPLRLADHFGVEPRQVLLRLADIPSDVEFPRFGLIECDMSGAVLLRKPIPALNPPQFSSACPLWPVYRAFARPRQMLRAVLDLPSGDRVMAYAVANATGHGGYDMPPMMRSVMAFCADPVVFPPARDIRAPILGGLHCSVCPRKDCPDRRADYILA
ncbi:MAG: short-chain fatty acyl-CoA regulator family protein [Pseudomonadota bacterium]